MKRFLTEIKNTYKNEPLIIALDFDGTLAAISPFPEKVEITPQMKSTLKEIEKIANVIIISGRPLSFLKKRLGFLKSAWFFALYGFETPSSLKKIPEREWTELKRCIKTIVKLASEYEGAWVENKAAGFVLHYRRVKNSLQKNILKNALKELNAKNVKIYEGKKALEVLAPSNPTKAEVLQKIASRKKRNEMLLFFGDDVADEDGFELLKRFPNSCGIVVGKKRSKAEYYATNVEEVRKCLNGIIKITSRAISSK